MTEKKAKTAPAAAASKQPHRTALRPTTLMDSVYQEILLRLQRGEIKSDERVLDYEVAREFECTRMPVRQALLRLVNEGYLIGTTRGFVMPDLDPEDIREIFEVRRLLEPSAAAGTVTVLKAPQLKAMNAAFRKCKSAYVKHDIALMMQANIEFRGIWIEAVRNSRLKGTILRFSDHTRKVRHGTMTKRGTMKIVMDGMQTLLKGFVDRDPDAVHAATEAFLDDAEQQYFLDEGGA
jgi:DNA-binding GntR family transcriptional regulator